MGVCTWIIIITGCLCLSLANLEAVESLLWQQFKEAKLTDSEPTLPDFSYAGYDYSESPLPDTSSWTIYDVSDFGALPDDEEYDDEAIQAAIDAAEAKGGGIVFFPPGRFMVSPNTNVEEAITINASNILMKGCGTVYLRYRMMGNQRIDSHSGSPYANLMDNVTGGHFDGNGGPHESYPHHGRHFVAWNFELRGGPDSYNFWSASRNGHTFAEPIFADLQGKAVTMAGEGINESPGEAVQPNSLFEAR